MQNLVLTRIDDRLIHGQVMTAWSRITNAEQVLVIDDGVAKDDFMINVLENAIPDTMAIGVFSKEDGVTFLSEPLEAPTIILAKSLRHLSIWSIMVSTLKKSTWAAWVLNKVAIACITQSQQVLRRMNRLNV